MERHGGISLGRLPAYSQLTVRPFLVAVLFVCLLLSGCASIVRPNYETEIIKLRSGAYELDPAHSFLIFKVNHLGLSTYVGRFNTLSATLDFDPQKIEQTQLDSVVAMNSIDVNDSELEERLQGGDWFNVAKYPEARFDTASVEAGTDGTFLFTGNMTFRGITKPVVLTARFNGGADNLLTRRYTLGFTATGTMKRSDFGMDAFDSLVGDDVELEIYAEFLRK